MNAHLKLALKVVGILVLAAIFVYSVIGVVVYSSIGRFPVKPLPKALIGELVWPTIGYPALVAPGATLEAEVELVGGEHVPSVWTALITPVREALKPLTYRITAAGARLARSARWPAGTARAGTVWHLRFDLPADTVPELYDVSVEWTSADGKSDSDAQPHALSVTDTDPESFRFITLADVHVHQPDVSATKATRSDKGISPDGTPVFFEKAIEQVNLIRPDFVVILGDCVLAQRYAGEYAPEFEHFYRALGRFAVPVFMVPGNHDCYVNGVDGARVWERSLGPLRYSFDVGSTHFTAMNTNDWPLEDRIVMDKLGLAFYPRKWQGQVLSALNEYDPGTYRGQLAWARDDLAAHSGSRLRVMLMHHDPWMFGGKGTPYRNERFYGLYSLGGDGVGRIAVRELASRQHVGLVLDGHMHRDYLASVSYADRSGATTYACQNAVSFDEGGVSSSYPGYRLIDVEEGRLMRLTYLDDSSSIPFYKGSAPEGQTDRDSLETPALATEGVLNTPSLWRVTSYLAEPILLRGVVIAIPVEAGPEPGISGAGVYRVVPIPGGTNELVYMETLMPAAQGSESSTSGTPAVQNIEVLPLR
ncbi:MAG: metallophosphoesterase [Actinomycetota bacterium]